MLSSLTVAFADSVVVRLKHQRVNLGGIVLLSPLPDVISYPLSWARKEHSLELLSQRSNLGVGGYHCCLVDFVGRAFGCGRVPTMLTRV